MRILILLAFVMFSSVTNAQSLICEGATATIAYGSKSPWGYESVSFTIKNARASVTRQYKYVWFSMACLANPSGKKLLVYQAYCSGSSCRDLDNWGIIDPVSLKFLLEPTDDNSSKAQAIMGSTLKPLK
ncbi:MAG: hypothetical protein V4525_04420 [Pseudomonadota bacterium]